MLTECGQVDESATQGVWTYREQEWAGSMAALAACNDAIRKKSLPAESSLLSAALHLSMSVPALLHVPCNLSCVCGTCSPVAWQPTRVVPCCCRPHAGAYQSCTCTSQA